VARDPSLARRFGTLFAACSAPDPLAREQALVALLAHLARRHAASPRPPAPGRAAVAGARARIDEDPSAPVTLAELAAAVGTGRYQLLRGFAREVSLTPHA
jgi:AraC-like DNA-binding protein